MTSVLSAECENDLQCLLDGTPKVHPSTVDVAVPGEDEFRPITNRTVCYIVCGLVFNDESEVLMMQEAKSSCYGMWYLPAGRMERNESIEEAVVREVLEETGIEIQPTSLVSVEVASGFWYRFTLIGRMTGGKLKTYEHRDKESLQAKWCSAETVKSGRKGFPLRASDILPLIDLGLKYHNAPKHHPSILPAHSPQKKLLIRIVCCHLSDETASVVMRKGEHPQFPIGGISVEDSTLYFAIFRLANELFNGPLKPTPTVKGVLSVEYCGKPTGENDGICLTLLLQIHSPDPGQPRKPLTIKNSERFEWRQIEHVALRQQIKERINEGLCVPLLLLR